MSETTFTPGLSYVIFLKNKDGCEISSYRYKPERALNFTVFCDNEHDSDNDKHIHSIEILTPDRIKYIFHRQFEHTNTEWINDDFRLRNWIYEFEYYDRKFLLNNINGYFTDHSCHTYLQNILRQNPDFPKNETFTIRWINPREDNSPGFCSAIYTLHDHALSYLSGDIHGYKYHTD